MISWLKRKDQVRPRRIDAPPERSQGQALVETSIESGSIILEGPAGDVSLVWKAGEKERRRALPPGDYRVRTTRIERMSGKEHWFLSSTGPAGRPRTLEADETSRLDVADKVRFQGRVERKGRRLQLGFAIQGADGRGLSVYRNDKRVPVTWKLLSVKDKVLASGKMNYG